MLLACLMLPLAASTHAQFSELEPTNRHAPLAAPMPNVKETSGDAEILNETKSNDVPEDETESASNNASVNAATTKTNPVKVSASPANKPTTTSTVSLAPTSLYQVGEGDVLDIRLLNLGAQTERGASTLNTVMSGGIIDYPLIGEPLKVAGMMTDEVDALITAELKRRLIFKDPQVLVVVREYASHKVIISGLVGNAGTKILRREALPLYVLLAEAQPQPDAAQATVVSLDGQTKTIALADSTAMNSLVRSGDVVRVSIAPPSAPQYFYIGGEIVAPGQKNFHVGITLTQAVLASGGATRNANKRVVRVARVSTDGRLVSSEYNLKEIEEGKIPDPLLQAGDRVEVGRGRWK